MAHSPAFQFYPGDFTGDRLTIPMTTVEIGAYWLLICECWDKGNQLPNDLSELADIARMSVGDFEKAWDKRIKKCFQFDDKKNVFTQKRLGEEIKKQKAWSKKKSEAGKKGMANRWKEKGTDDNTVITVLGSDITQDNSPSLSSSSSSTQEEESITTTTATPKLTDDEWLQTLADNPAYKQISVEIEYERAKVWAAANNRQCTRRFFVNWLNRAKPMEVKTNGSNQTSNGRYYKRTDADVIAESEEFYRNYPG